MRRKSEKPARKKKSAAAVGKVKAPPQPEIFPIVGIGASAGGIEASSELLSKLHPKLSMAYVFIHHLAPDYESNLSEILQRHTDMPVIKVGDGVRVEPDHAYVIPPNTFMKLEHGQLTLRARSATDVPFHPIDSFFISLADQLQENAIGILLSGTATDGTLGLKAIKDSGGITMVQDQSAKHSQMPRNAQDAGYANLVLSLPGLADELLLLNRHPFIAVKPEEEVARNEESIKKILGIVLQKRGVDFFSHYKRTTVFRRIMRRMALLKIPALDAYLKLIKKDDTEVDALYHDFLINVTSFFREPAFYTGLVKNAFPHLVKNLGPTDPIRIWIAGCATGEEAYSTAICLAEFLQQKKLSNPVHIFSTDLNGNAIEKARLGIYPKSLVAHISLQRLKRFFVKIDGHYQLIKSIREMCIFSQHNLLRDPPFSRIDLISCQNVLIYLESVPQRRIFQAFHYALKPTGFLLMGKSESIGTAMDFFQPFEKDGRLYTRKSAMGQRLEFGVRHPPVLSATSMNATPVRLENDIDTESDNLLLSRYVPASVLVSKDLEIIRFRGIISPYLEPSPGKASLNLLKMVKDDLLFDLRTALQKAKKSGVVATQENIVFNPREKPSRLSIEVTPMKSGKAHYYLIVFREVIEEQPLLKTVRGTKVGEQNAKVQKLEQALANAREQIRAISEEFDDTRGELQSANEEVLSSNEELQSINEELETSKEELQSSNEELTTINEELQNRNLELKLARDYAEGIIETMRGPLMVLNTEMRVRTANRAFYNFFQLKPEETTGAFVYELGDRHWNIPALRDQLQDILPQKMEFKDFLINHDFPGIGRRIMIINAQRLVQDMQRNEALILLSFEDITPYKHAEQSLRETQEQLKLALEGGSAGTWAWDIRTNELSGSIEEERLFGLPKGTALRNYADWVKNMHPLDRDLTRQALHRSIQDKVPLDVEFRVVWPEGDVRWMLAKANTYYGAGGRPEKMMGISIDITARRTAIEALEESEKRFHAMSDNAPVMIWMAGPDRDITFLNKTWLSFTGKTPEEESGEGWFASIHPEDKEVFLEAYNASFETGNEFKIDYRLKRYDGEYRWIMNHGVPRFAGNQRFIGFIGMCVDITDRIDLERQKDDFMGIASHELKTPVTSIKAYTQILQEKFRKINDEVSASMMTRLDRQIDKLTGLINTLLDVAKVQSGQMDYVQAFFDMREFILEVTEEMQQTCPKHIIVTKLETEGKLFADRERLTQVFTNLLSNAVKYSPDAREVIVEAVRKDGQYIFSVQDFGVGISRDMQERIFGRFFRVSESSGNSVAGLGLGLFISSQIIKQQGGKLWLESTPGNGSKFFFSLPVKDD